MSLTSIPAGGPTITDPARTAAVHAIHFSIEDQLAATSDLVDDYISDGGPIALTDARNLLASVVRKLDALEQLGPPLPTDAYCAGVP
jgi:hypothetical protein